MNFNLRLELGDSTCGTQSVYIQIYPLYSPNSKYQYKLRIHYTENHLASDFFMIFQEVNNRLEFMCEILHVHVHRHMYTEDLDVLNTSEIGEICEIPIAYKDINGVIYNLTPVVCIMLSKFK